jgi:Zn finger protein HypA/HybF involved in hydrogenase expression
MFLTCRSSLEKTNGRALCPKCKAPMWNVGFHHDTAADKRTFQCPRCEVVVLEATAERKSDPVAALCAAQRKD